jgi:metal-dependent amidase/aminoacylase/carboxypeptidase family protein
MCGHDMHVAWLVGAATLLSEARDAWKGTLMAVFQPGEETAQGAQAMIDDGLLKRFPTPDVVLGQHVMVGPAGSVAGSAGPITSAADSLQIRLFGRGAHGSMPQASIDPVVMAASVVLRLQTIVSREVAANDAAVVTVGVLQAGTKENVIPDEAVIKLNVRTFDAGVRKHVLAAIERIVNAEAEGSGAPRKPEITPLDRYPLNVNDETASNRIAAAFRGYFSADRVRHTGPAPASTPRRNWRLGWAGCAGPSRICHSVLESELSTWVAIGVNPAAMRVDPSRSGGKNLVAAHKASPMQLSAEHERELNSLVRAHSTPQKLAERARIILLAAAGLGVEETAQQLGIWRKTAGHWRRRWRNADAATGVAARLSDASRCGAPATFTPEVICQIMALACEDPETLDVPINHWSQSELARQSVARGIVKNISHGSVGRFLKKRPISNRTATATG